MLWRRAFGACAPEGLRRPLGLGGRWSLRRGMSFLRVGPGARRGVLFLCAPVAVSSPSWPLGGFLLPRCVAPGALSLWAPACHFEPFLAPLPECPCLPLALPFPVSFPFPVWWWWGGGGGAPMAQAWGWLAWSHWRRVLEGVGGLEALDRVPEEGLPCRLRHDGLQGGLAGVGGGAGADLLEGVHHVHPFSPSRSRGPLHSAAELLQGETDHQARWAGAWGGEGSELEVLEWREEDVDMRRWRGRWRLGERERRWWGLGVEDGCGGRGEREARWGPRGEGEVDMGRPWCAWRRLREGGRWWRGRDWESCTGGGGSGRPGGARGGRGGWTWGGAGARGGAWGGGGIRAEAGPRGVVVAPWEVGAAQVGGWGAAAVWGAWVPGVGAPCGGTAGAPPFAGPGLVARVGPVRRCRRVLRGLARRCLVLGGGGGVIRPQLIRPVGVQWRQWLLVRVE